MKKKAGFSLIEILISAAIVITSATIVVAIITATFRVSNKTSSNEQIRQAGNSAVSQLSSMIQYAESFKGAVKNSIPLKVCNTLDLDISVDNIIISVNGEDKTIACISEPDLTLNGSSMFNKGKYVVTHCELSCSQTDSNEPPLIKLQFGLGSVGSSFSENSSSLDFSKTIKMVNL